eukprot:11177993-Lingulodinium_polyedra.AAC.1
MAEGGKVTDEGTPRAVMQALCSKLMDGDRGCTADGALQATVLQRWYRRGLVDKQVGLGGSETW